MAASRLGHYRRSCDRCHDQKLRCRRDEDSQSCQRCRRAGAKCTFSAPARSRWSDPFVFSRYQPAGPAPSPDATLDIARHAGDSVIAPDFDQPGTSLADTPGIPWDTGPAILPFDLTVDAAYGQGGAGWAAAMADTSRTSVGAESAWLAAGTGPHPGAAELLAAGGTAEGLARRHGSFDTLPPSTSAQSPRGLSQRPRPVGPRAVQGDGATAGRAVRTLSNLSVELHDFALAMPSLEACWEQPGAMGGKEFALDKMLKLCQCFIETLDQLLTPALSSVSTGCSDSDANTPESSSSAGARTPSSLDQPCELLTMSSYMRIVETFHAILEHVAACANHHREVAEGKTAAVSADDLPRLPSLAVGSFTMESSNATQVLVVVHMMEAMMTRSRSLMQRIVRTCAPASPGGGEPETRTTPTVGQAALKGFLPREEATLQLIGTVRRALLELVDAERSP